MENADRVRIVLDRTSHPGNIGAAARAMKVMGLTGLHLVRPGRFPHSQATALASSADDVLDRARVHDSLHDAIADCTLVLGTSARRRSVAQEVLDPRAAAVRALAEPGPVAILFGTEKSGLDNAALDRCHALLSIPTGDAYMSLNLAQAVQVICYELHLAARGRVAREQAGPGDPEAASAGGRVAASAGRMEVFFDRLERTLAAIRFSTPGQTETLHRRLRRLFLRARPDDHELDMLNGILSRTMRLADNDERRRTTESDR
ncbi:MAG: RNA methyltransferase [Wenzhouxiangellaceae bacterium]|nr:RNA methyltransferase [Wenzhouxiangellaceae bacterium]